MTSPPVLCTDPSPGRASGAERGVHSARLLRSVIMLEGLTASNAADVLFGVQAGRLVVGGLYA